MLLLALDSTAGMGFEHKEDKEKRSISSSMRYIHDCRMSAGSSLHVSIVSMVGVVAIMVVAGWETDDGDSEMTLFCCVDCDLA